ncbi:hypothetical protein P20652_3543 [Pseudoalteromonas sp. BSi20652]|uniref:hypothetical protein n=1 Tax=Pseudoalteromonas sp. BSi20652 TaxID=388384 RepID=UPI0002317665|nr:hypothetical protein [Pseudoalteromonas sp. BSi20652]GAA61654.1 hypothetical protein P20652_3543 [Pseudoalteromonas sp. BSi20652]
MKKIFKPARKLHTWLGYLLALQILAWLLGGLVMSAIPLDKVHGEHLATRTLSNPFTQTDYVASLDKIASQVANPTQITFENFLTTPLITVTNKDEQQSFNGKTGRPFEPPTKMQITKNAKAHLLINAQPISTLLLKQGTREVGYKTNVWQVQFDDTFNTTLYLSKNNGKVITVRSTLWRIFDFFWMLHIMDYDEREDFNNPLLISFAATSVLFCLSGVLLLVQNIRRQRFIRITSKNKSKSMY